MPCQELLKSLQDNNNDKIYYNLNGPWDQVAANRMFG